MKNYYEVHGEITKIFAKSYKAGQLVEGLIDTNDLEFVNSYPFTWTVSNSGYIVARKNNSNIFLHKYLIPSSGPVDHINHNKSDNRRSNLREVSPSENAQNNSIRSDNTSGYRGVYWCKQNNKWAAYLKYEKRKKHFGFYNDVKEAAAAAENGRFQYFPYLKLISQVGDLDESV